MPVKIAPLKVKAAGEADGLEDGQFIGYASVFGNVDSYGDIVEPGAFSKTIAEWEKSGDPIPCLWGHDFRDPFSNIGHVLAAEEDDRGLKVHVQLDLENPTAKQVYRLCKGRRVTDMSFAFDVNKSTQKDDGNHLEELSLYEVSVVPIGANRETDILAVKAINALSDGLKAGRVLSASNEKRIRSAVGELSTVLSALDSQNNDTTKNVSGDQAGAPAESEEPQQAKDDARGRSLVQSAAHELLALEAELLAL